MSGRNIFKKFSWFFVFCLALMKIFPFFIKVFFLSFFASVPTRFGVFVRYLLLKSLIPECGNNVYVGRWVVFKNFNNLRIGNNVSFHEYCYIDAKGGITIGNDVSIAHSSSIVSFEHSWADSSLPIKYNPILEKSIKISNDVWIGCGCRILAGVEIGNRCIVAAGAVVVKNVEDNTLVGGIPASIIKKI